MYAVIVSGAKQYRVKEGQVIKLEKLDVEPGAAVEFDKVLLVNDGKETKIGAPYLSGGKVAATVESHGRHKKIKVVHFRRRKHHHKQMGHRQWYTAVKITGITGA